MKRYKKYIVLVMIFLTALANTSRSQTPDPGCDPLDPACPIDGGVSLLIATGIYIGARRIYLQKSKTAVNSSTEQK